MIRIEFESISDITNHIAKETHLLAVSDGSVKTPHMTSVWVISTPSGTRLANGMGPCHGRPSSLRSKASAMLSASLFLGMIQEFTGHAFTCIPVTFAADNISLIRRQRNRLGYDTCYPNLTLASEYDLIEQTHQTHRKYHIQATFVHVKGHQDSTSAVDKLPLEAQLNVEADQLAGSYYLKGPLSTTQVSVLHVWPC